MSKRWDVRHVTDPHLGNVFLSLLNDGGKILRSGSDKEFEWARSFWVESKLNERVVAMRKPL